MNCRQKEEKGKIESKRELSMQKIGGGGGGYNIYTEGA
jgi:hypothetical protein